MLFHITEKDPPKNEPFLALSDRGFEMMEWKERIIDAVSKGWFSFYCPCSCCNGHCSMDFEWWMPMPQLPRIRTHFDEARWATFQENMIRMKILEKMDPET